jgi:hypothetical protein
MKRMTTSPLADFTRTTASSPNWRSCRRTSSLLDYEKIGNEMHVEEGGVFHPNAMWFRTAKLRKCSQRDAIPKEKTGLRGLLHAMKRFFESPDDDQKLYAP